MAIRKAYYSATMNALIGHCKYLSLAPEGHEKEIAVSEVVEIDSECYIKWPDVVFVGHVTDCVKPYPLRWDTDYGILLGGQKPRRFQG